MADDIPSNTETKAAGLVRRLSDEEFITLSKDQTGVLVDAVERDMITLAEKITNDEARLTRDEDRLTKLETQTQVLAEAVVAITKTDKSLAPAVRAVKDEMHAAQTSTEPKGDAPAPCVLDVAGLTDIAAKVRGRIPAA